TPGDRRRPPRDRRGARRTQLADHPRGWTHSSRTTPVRHRTSPRKPLMTSQRPVLFIDRDGTLIEEPADCQIDSYEKLRLVPGIIPALSRLRDAGWDFIMVSNQN